MKQNLWAAARRGLLLAVACLGGGLRVAALTRTPRLVVEDSRYGVSIDRHTDINDLRETYSQTHALDTSEMLYAGALLDVFYIPDPEIETIYLEKTAVYYTMDGRIKVVELWSGANDGQVRVNGVPLGASEAEVVGALGDADLREESLDQRTWYLEYHFGYESVRFGFREGREGAFLIAVDYDPY